MGLTYGDPCPVCHGTGRAYDTLYDRWRAEGTCTACDGTGQYQFVAPAHEHTGQSRYDDAEYPGRQHRHTWETGQIAILRRSRSYQEFAHRCIAAHLFMHTLCAWKQRRRLERRKGNHVIRAWKGPHPSGQ